LAGLRANAALPIFFHAGTVTLAASKGLTSGYWRGGRLCKSTACKGRKWNEGLMVEATIGCMQSSRILSQKEYPAGLD